MSEVLKNLLGETPIGSTWDSYMLIKMIIARDLNRLKCLNTRIHNDICIYLKIFEGYEIIIYVENPKESFQLLKLISDCRKVIGYEVSKQKSIAFLYISNKFEIKNTMPFTLTPKET